MKNVFLTEYSINGIKNLNKEVTLSFYKKTITKPIDTTELQHEGCLWYEWLWKVRDHCVC